MMTNFEDLQAVHVWIHVCNYWQLDEATKQIHVHYINPKTQIIFLQYSSYKICGFAILTFENIIQRVKTPGSPCIIIQYAAQWSLQYTHTNINATVCIILRTVTVWSVNQ